MSLHITFFIYIYDDFFIISTFNIYILHTDLKICIAIIYYYYCNNVFIRGRFSHGNSCIGSGMFTVCNDIADNKKSVIWFSKNHF